MNSSGLMSSNLRRGVLLWLLAAFAGILGAQTNDLDSIPGYASVSALVVDLDDGAEIYSLDADRLMTPASLMKLVSTSVALETLGGDYEFSTGIWIQGDISSGILEGNLIIEGGGDPTLGSRYFPQASPDQIWNKIRRFLDEVGIKTLKGKILVDEQLFDAPRFPSARLWEDMGNYYGAPPTALTFRDNTFELTLQSPPAVDERCSIVSVRPKLDPLTFVSRVMSSAHDQDSAYIYGVPGMDEWCVRGAIPAGRAAFTIKGALPYPGMVLGHELAREVFSLPGLEVAYTSNPDWKEEAHKIGEIKSPSLAKIIQVINRQSNNLMADHLLPALVNHSGRQGSYWDVGPALIKSFWSAHDRSSPVEIFDGSGLSPSNALSARFLVRVLETMYHSSSSEIFLNSLAVSGSSGTLLKMWNTPALKGYVHAKSGSMRNVMGYAGYVLSPGMPPRAFALMVNHHGLSNAEIRKIIEKKIERILSMP